VNADVPAHTDNHRLAALGGVAFLKVAHQVSRNEKLKKSFFNVRHSGSMSVELCNLEIWKFGLGGVTSS
jgi:hypothetical protein